MVSLRRSPAGPFPVLNKMRSCVACKKCGYTCIPCRSGLRAFSRLDSNCGARRTASCGIQSRRLTCPARAVDSVQRSFSSTFNRNRGISECFQAVIAIREFCFSLWHFDSASTTTSVLHEAESTEHHRNFENRASRHVYIFHHWTIKQSVEYRTLTVVP